MKLSYAATLLGLGLGTLGLALGQGCSSSSSGGTTANTGTVPPPAPSGPMTTSTTAENFALHQIFLGDTDRNQVPGPNAWKNFGYNLDGKITTASSTDVCTLAQGAAKSAQADGTNGIDNSFGENILPILLPFAATPSKTISGDIDKGAFTIMFDVVGLSSDPAQTATGLTGQLFAGAKFNGMPTWSPADDWPVRPELLKDMMTIAGGSTIKFGSAYVVNGTWVNGTPADVTLSLSIQGHSLNITVHQAIVTFDHTAPDKATNGTVAGVIQTEELITSLKAVAGNITKSLCMGTAFDSIAQQIRQASDIMHDGTNSAGQACDGISIGIGFNADHIGDPKTVAPATVASCDPCSPTCGGADAGVDSGSGDSGVGDTGVADTGSDATGD